MVVTCLQRFLLAFTGLIFISTAHASDASSTDLSIWSSYAQSIKYCTPGTFQLPDILQIAVINTAKQSGSFVPSTPIRTMTYTIQGWQSGTCQLIVKMPPSEGESSSKKLICALDHVNLPILSESAASIAGGTFTMEDKFIGIMDSSCK